MSVEIQDTVAEQAMAYRDEASFLWTQRQSAVVAPHYSPRQFAELDDQLDAHLDGLREGGDVAWGLCEEGLTNAGAEDFFVMAALSTGPRVRTWPALVERTQQGREVLPGLTTALAWLPVGDAMGAVAQLTGHDDPLSRRLILDAYGGHRRHPASMLGTSLRSAHADERTRALRLAGELGTMQALPEVMASLSDPKTGPRFAAAWSAVLLGDRQHALEALQSMALRLGPRQDEAFRLALMTLSEDEAHRLLVETEALPTAGRLRVIGAGYAGQTRYVPWLIDRMSQPETARIAAEAFVHITGADFNLDGLEAMPPDGFEDGPTDDPDDDDVEVPEDIALPWPDVERVKAWWDQHKARLSVPGRLFLGRPVTEVSCTHVLNNGLQRQRVIAALYLSLIRPGAPLFQTDAPAWRQQRLLSGAG
jgi:uncharacterized protein (TIGR02270 family)